MVVFQVCAILALRLPKNFLKPNDVSSKIRLALGPYPL